MNIRVLKESPRWLAEKGRLQEAEKLIRRACKWNRTSHKMPEDLHEKLVGFLKCLILSVCSAKRKVLSTTKTFFIQIIELILFVSAYWINKNLTFKTRQNNNIPIIILKLGTFHIWEYLLSNQTCMLATCECNLALEKIIITFFKRS